MKSIASKPAGGFCFMRVRSILAAWTALKLGTIALFDLRLFLACHEATARRCRIEPGRKPVYSFDELVALVGTGTRSKAKKAVERLEVAGLLRWDRHDISLDTARAEALLAETSEWSEMLDDVTNNQRKVPVPRRILRFMARSRSKTLIGTVFGHLLRCLYYRKDRCVSGGRCKASWAARVFTLDLRNCRAARRRLTEMGWLIPCEANQIALNRWGLAAMVNLNWDGAAKCAQSPPRNAVQEPQTPPLYINKKLSTITENQKPGRSRPGVKNRTGIRYAPTLRHITLEDLRDPMRLDHLYREATEAGSLRQSVSTRMSWFAAAEHALTVGKQNPCGLFATLYRRKLWRHITQADEDAARATLKRLDYGEESRLPGQLAEVVGDYGSLAA